MCVRLHASVYLCAHECIYVCPRLSYTASVKEIGVCRKWVRRKGKEREKNKKENKENERMEDKKQY